jgi:hypothetical protein
VLHVPRKNNALSLDVDTESATGKPALAWETLLDEITRRHPDFSCRKNLTRHALHANRR